MKCLDLTMPSAAENLALDEVLLDRCEESAEEALRFWESPEYFVVVGYGNSIAQEVNQAACQAGKIPILRRCTGGGTVVQGPGCVNYSLVLRADVDGPLQSITSTNRFIMERNRAALQALVDSQSQTANRTEDASPARRALSSIQIKGCTDLAIDDVKFSGNAQRRKKRALLFHSTSILN
jgi:lipoate---protein ligase